MPHFPTLCQVLDSLYHDIHINMLFLTQVISAILAYVFQKLSNIYFSSECSFLPLPRKQGENNAEYYFYNAAYIPVR